MIVSAKRRESQRKWYLKNREQVLLKARQYRIDHAEDLNEYNRQYYQKHKEERRSYAREYYATSAVLIKIKRYERACKLAMIALLLFSFTFAACGPTEYDSPVDVPFSEFAK